MAGWSANSTNSSVCRKYPKLAAVRSELLLDAAEPGLGALPGVVWAVEEIRAVGAVAGGEENVGGAGLCFEPGFAGEGVGGVVAVGDEAVGGVAGAGDLFGERAGGVGGAEMVFSEP